MTNGVSFSLVAGALCCLYFSNAFSSSSFGTTTININSSGAKSIQHSTGAMSGQSYPAAFPLYATREYLAIYTNSKYMLFAAGMRNTYSDSSD